MINLKILICTPEYPPYASGIGNVVFNLEKQLKKNNLDLEFKICSPEGPDFKIGNSKLMGKCGILGLIYFSYIISRYFKQNDFDLIWIHGNIFPNTDNFKNVFITLHTTYRGYKLHDISPKLYYKLVNRLEEYVLNRINIKSNIKFSGVSPEVCEEISNITDINKDNIKYIPNGVDTNIFKPSNSKQKLRKKFKLPQNDQIILSVGRLVEQKQPILLLEIFSFIEKNVKNVTLVIAGEGELLNEMKRIIKTNNIKKVRFLGNVTYKDMPDLYSCSDYFIITSNYEGQPLTLLEAMSTGLRCIVSEITNLSSIIKEANCGISVDVTKTENAANQIINYLKSDNSIHSANSRNYVVKNCDWKIISDLYLKEIEKIIN